MGAATSRGVKNTRPGIDQQSRVILDAAVELFSAHGTRAVSVSAVCKQAGISRDTFYRCFADKDALIDRLYQASVSEHMLSALDTGEADFGDRQWLHAAIDQTVDAILARHKMASFLFIESADPNSHAYQVIDKAFDAVARRMQGWCRQCYGHSPTRECFKGLLMAAQWLVHQAIISGMGKRDVNRVKQSMEQLFYATFTGLASASG
jgi:AcrR family transcriptional regulator